MIRFYRGVIGSTDKAPLTVCLCRYGYLLLELRGWFGAECIGHTERWWHYNVYGVYIEWPRWPRFMGTQHEVRGRIQDMDAKAFTAEFDKFSRS